MSARTINGSSTFYDEQGQGMPLVLLHGFPLDSRIWAEQRKTLSERWRVITPELRGFGRSASSDAFTMKSLADDVHAFLLDIVALPCVLGGLSMGGYVALEYVMKYPSDLKALILIDTKAEGDSAEGKEARQKMIELVRVSGSKAVAEQMLPRMLAPEAETHRAGVAKELRSIMEACPARTIENALSAMRDRADHSRDLTRLATPTLILVGESDAITPPAVAEAMHRAIADSRLVVIRGAGHLSPMEQPQQVNQTIRAFLETL